MFIKYPVALGGFDDYGHFRCLHTIRLSRLSVGNRGSDLKTDTIFYVSVCFHPVDLLQMETTALGHSRCDVIQIPNGLWSFL